MGNLHHDLELPGLGKRVDSGEHQGQVNVLPQGITNTIENSEPMQLPDNLMVESLGREHGRALEKDGVGGEGIEAQEIVDQKPEHLNFGDAAHGLNSSQLANENKACRICLWDDEEPGDPIIQPCKCSGTMKNVHINCFKSWIGKKVDRKESASMISVFWKRLQCEICHTEVSRNN